MLELIELSEDRFQSVLDQALETYVREKCRAEGVDEAETRDIACQQISEILPQGQMTWGHYFLEIRDLSANHSVGHIWCGLKDRSNQQIAFIYDFLIEPPFRGLGLGKEALRILEQFVLGLGVKRIALHVFRTNLPAISLYKSLGYLCTTGGVNSFEMEKSLEVG